MDAAIGCVPTPQQPPGGGGGGGILTPIVPIVFITIAPKAKPSLPPLVKPAYIPQSQWQAMLGAEQAIWDAGKCGTDGTDYRCQEITQAGVEGLYNNWNHDNYYRTHFLGLPEMNDGSTGISINACLLVCVGWSQSDTGRRSFSFGIGPEVGISAGSFVSTLNTDLVQIQGGGAVGPVGVSSSVGLNSSSVSYGGSVGFKFGAAAMFNFGY